MRVLLLNHTFHPDVMASAQYLTDLAKELAARGHEVTVISSRRAYDDPTTQFPALEIWNGIHIERVWTTRLGKSAKWKRVVDFASFIVSCATRMAFTPRPDVVVALTSPPLISFLGACFARWRRCGFVYWVMDLNPDEAIAAGWLKENSIMARLLHAMSVFSFRSAAKIVVLDRFMRDRVRAKEIPEQKIAVLPPWSQDDEVRFDSKGREEFRATHQLKDRFVVMYSGNHSPCHPLTNLLSTAKELATNGDTRVVFCFIGGGSEFAKVKQFAASHALPNIVCLPYQPLDKLAASLSAADLHVVVMGDPFVGTIHPCKIYNILKVGAPTLYIGPEESHVTDIFRVLATPIAIAHVSHGDAARTLSAIDAARNQRSRPAVSAFFTEHFSKSVLLKSLADMVENSAHPPRPSKTND
ncbi:MAG TPA: glycosyltransferase family 4 protein [Candidatus Acidoferrum sp.]|nr:glycosyltransferase family 4 protein [Candidatus Acidoferrum sp.]